MKRSRLMTNKHVQFPHFIWNNAGSLLGIEANNLDAITKAQDLSKHYEGVVIGHSPSGRLIEATRVFSVANV